MNLSNTQVEPVALVTGAARRIGAAIVTELHQAGYKVLIHCHRAVDEAQALAWALNQKRTDSAWVIVLDLREKNAPDHMLNSIMQRTRRLDLLINNASVFTQTHLEQSHIEAWDELFYLNVKVPFLLSTLLRPLLAQQQGAIINLTDIHADRPLKNYAIYCQTKAALKMQTKALALEFAPQIRVNAIAPGAIAWPEEGNSLTAKQQQKIIAKTPLNCHGNPSDIAHMVRTLAENKFITGQTIRVDGGRSI